VVVVALWPLMVSTFAARDALAIVSAYPTLVPPLFLSMIGSARVGIVSPTCITRCALKITNASPD
jgi:hypothetical protein